MGKIIIRYNDSVVDHVELKQGDMKVGRRAGCEIVLDHLAVSGEHANIFTIGGDSFIQDLGSTNGTFINNKRIAKHHLRNGDSVNIGQHTLVYLNEPVESVHEGNTLAKTVIINPGAPPSAAASVAPQSVARPAAPPEPVAATGEKRGGVLFVLDGKNSGKRIELTKTITNLGKTGRHAGVITLVGGDYVLDAVDESDRPRLNSRAIPQGGTKLRNGDIIEVAGTRVQFYLK